MKKPRLLILGLTLLVLLYFIWPRDLLPDAFGLAGRLDDLALLAFVIYRYRRWKRTARATESWRTASASQTSSEQEIRKVFDPYTVLGVQRNATREEIRAAYKKLATQYHPDKVTHLGPDLQEIAHEKMVTIQRAYQQLAAN